MRSAWAFAILIPLAYLLGSIPFGLLVGRMKGIDPRTSGSGNIGATNLGRLLGLRYFWLVFLLDMSKSLLPMLAAAALLHARSSAWTQLAADRITFLLWLAVGIAAIFGHMFSVFLRFRGGKGVATSAGVMLGLFPYFTIPALIGVTVFILVFLPWRYISLASMSAAIAFPLAYVLIGWLRHWPLLGAQLPLLLAAVLIAAMIFLRHRANVVRLLAGTESRFQPSH